MDHLDFLDFFATITPDDHFQFELIEKTTGLGSWFEILLETCCCVCGESRKHFCDLAWNSNHTGKSSAKDSETKPSKDDSKASEKAKGDEKPKEGSVTKGQR